MQLSQYPRYDAYVETGFEWIKDVPEHWSISKLGSCLTPVSDKNHSDQPLLSITREEGVIARDVEDQSSNHNFIPDDLSNYKLVRTGQFAMNKMKAWQGSYGVSKHTGIVSPAYFIFDFTKPFDPQFFNIAIRSKLYITYFASASDGVRVGQWDLNKTRMKAIPFLVPPLPEQQAIAQFIDEKTAKIDQAVKIKEDQIALLKERKQIVIQEAVTKGLNPDAPMKDSGIDWIGEIPAHWDIKRLKFVTKIVKRIIGFEGPDVLSITQKGIKIKDVQSGEGQLAADYSNYQIVEAGDFAMNHMDLVTGYVDISKYDGITSPDYRVFKNVSDDVEDLFLLLLFQIGYKFKTFFKYGQGVHTQGRWRLPASSFNNFFIPIPPLAEQKSIIETIEAQSAKVDAAIALKQRQIDTLKEYKATLINAAVTGKIKVI